MDEAGGMVAYQNEHGDLKALPQLSTMQKASAEIRALNKLLGIGDESKSGKEEKSKKATILTMVVNDRARKASGT